MGSPEQLVSVRYMVDDVQAAIGFYTSHMAELFEPAPGSPARP